MNQAGKRTADRVDTMELGFNLTIEQAQKLVMTPELLQAIKVLQLNSQELEAFISEQLLTNPVLEVAEPAHEKEAQDPEDMRSPETAKQDAEEDKSNEDDMKSVFGNDRDWRDRIRDNSKYDDISYRQWEYSRDSDDYSFEQFATRDVTLVEHLLFQLQFAELSQAESALGRYIIESLDDNGYMTMSRADIAETFRTTPETVEKVLDAIHGFEPAGVGAEDLKECLLIQLGNREPRCELAEAIVKDHLEDLASNRMAVIAKALGASVTDVQEACDVIRGLEPKPGRQFADQSATKYITPDVIVERVNGEYVVTANEYVTPRLMVSSYYENLLSQADTDKQLEKYLSGRINSAMWVIKSIEQRKQTIINVATTVVRYQRDFFDHGDKFLKPLTLKQIAEEVGIHESTVSRSINGKYMQTPRGIFEIRRFFSSGVAGLSEEGVSSNSIKSFIREMVDSEDPKSPYSDQDMADMLAKRGITISRRTVAKYRDEMQILSSSKRRRY